MRSSVKVIVLAILTLASSVSVSALPSANTPSAAIESKKHTLYNRQLSCSSQESISNLSLSNPVKAANKVLDIKHVMRDHGPLWDDENIVPGKGWFEQVPWARGAKYDFDPFARGDFENGFRSIPRSFSNFKLDHSVVLRRKGDKVAKAPVYINSHYDSKKIERVVIILPGQWRDSWSSINTLGNALRVAEKYSELNVNEDNILLLSPVFLNQNDHKRGALKSDEIYFQDSGWAAAGTTRGPDDFRGISSYSVIDHFVDFAFNTSNFPNMKRVVIAGHSMGAQAALRYAILRKSQKHDKKISYWVGNPGSFLYLDDKRPMSNHTSNCSDYNNFPMGFHGSHPKYVSQDFENSDKIVSRFENRRVHYSFGMDDNGGRSDKCSVNAQGPNRLARGALWIKHLARVYGGFPDTHSVDFASCISHQDYPMFAHYEALKFLFTTQED